MYEELRASSETPLFLQNVFVLRRLQKHRPVKAVAPGEAEAPPPKRIATGGGLELAEELDGDLAKEVFGWETEGGKAAQVRVELNLDISGHTVLLGRRCCPTGWCQGFLEYNKHILG